MKRYAAALLLPISFLAHAQPEAGKDYLPIDPPLQIHEKKIELIEFFYYGCPECLDLEPFLNNWLQGRRDIRVVRIPAFRSSWLPLARTYYALSILGQEDRLRSRIFQAMHQGIDLNSEEVLFGWIGSQGVDAEKFKSVYHSKLVRSRIMESEDLARKLGISGVPSLVVDGKFLVLGNLADEDRLDELIDMAKKMQRK